MGEYIYSLNENPFPVTNLPCVIPDDQNWSYNIQLHIIIYSDQFNSHLLLYIIIKGLEIHSLPLNTN